MSQLGYDSDGEPLDLPETAAGWRVKRLKGGKGAPGMVYGADGTPLMIPIDADIDDLRREVIVPGRYRLDAVDENRKELGVKAAYACVRESDPSTEVALERNEPQAAQPNAMTVVIEAMRQNGEMARTIVERFPAMLEASATLLRAADGAGLPARTPRFEALPAQEDRDADGEPDDDDGDGGEAELVPTPAPGFDLNGLLAQLVPVLLTAFSKGELKLPNLGEMLDWRRAARRPAQSGPSSRSATACPGMPRAAGAVAKLEPLPAASDAPAPATAAELPPLSPQAMAHFLAIQSALTPEESALARSAASELSPEDLRAWFDQLSALSVPDAVARVRALLGVGAAEAA